MSLLKDMKVSSLVCKCVFYIMQRGNPMKVNFKALEMQEWNITTDRAERVDEKNGVISLVIMFASRLFADNSKTLITF